MGAAGLFGAGVTLPGLLRASEAGDRGDVSLIVVYLKGGLSTIDTFDMKPDAPAEFRGDFKPIDTNVSGVRIGELLPRVAQQMDKFSLIRSFRHHNSDH
ncbi:MAG TPA: DUF1501 domain-containing protein, partial [Pirellulales bacterium]|nr:DUF1501 domain-containing protein [Pirellulales bacterium]